MSEYLVEQGRLARAWREGRGLSRARLGLLIGYSASEIECMENGRRSNTGAPVKEADFLTYKLACAAVAANVGFDWGPITLTIGP